MNTRHAQLVLTIARFGSITAAAKALYLTQPTLSATLKQIETQVGEPLFVRGRASMELTRAGELYVQAARRIIQIETQLDEAIATLHGKQEGALHLGLPIRRAGELLPQILPDFIASWPGIRIEVTEGTAEQLEQKLLSHELDIAFITGDGRCQELTYRLIATEELVLLAGKNTQLAQRIPSGSTINLAEAANERFLLPGSHQPGRRIYDELLEKNGVVLHDPAIELESFEASKRICSACQMVMLSPYISLLSDTASMQRLSHYHLTGDCCLHRFVMAYPTDTPPAPYAEAFYTLMSSRFRSMTAYRA